jgi:hypothetical protein
MATEALQIDALWSGLMNPNNGKAYSGAIVATYASDGSTPKAVWENKEKNQPDAGGKSQFTLDSSGAAEVFGDGVYVIKVYAPTDTGLTNPLRTLDGLNYNIATTTDLFETDHNTDGSHIVYESIADLRASTLTPFDGQVVKVTGYYAGTENRDWFFRWNALSTTTDDSGVYIKVTAITTGRWVRMYEEGLKPTWYGCVGDGVTDDTAKWASWNTAMLTLDIGGWIPNGVYLIDSWTITGAAKVITGQEQGTIGLDRGVVIKCRSSVTDFVTLESTSRIQLSNLLVDGNNLATNTVRMSNNQTDTVLRETTIFGCVDGGKNLSIWSKTPDTQVSELKFYGVQCAGRDGGSGITNLYIDTNQAVVISFYDFKSSGNNDTDVDYGVDISEGTCTFNTPFFVDIAINDLRIGNGAVTIIDGRSESTEADSINVASGTGDITLVNYVHGSDITKTTLIVASAFDGRVSVIGGQYTNVIQNSTNDPIHINNAELYVGGAITGTYPDNVLITGGFNITGRAKNAYSGSTLINTNGISSTSVDAKNLTGQVTISGTDVNAVETFAVAETDTDYNIIASSSSITGGPNNGAYVVQTIDKTTTNFTISVTAAPGAGTSVTFDWILVR